jgi:AraC-like DNA-binding protein
LSRHPVDAASAATLSGIIRDAVDNVLTVDAARFPLLLESATHQLTTAVLTTFSGHGHTESTFVDHRDATSLTLGSAKTFIEEHAAESITLTQIAAAAHVTARSVQYAFADIGSTPLAYLRRVRLEHAHAELKAGSRDGGATVTEIALTWGFSHQGRFAAAYRDRYGVRPGATLRG